MGTINTMFGHNQSISFGAYRYTALDQVSLRVWMTVALAIVAAKMEKRRTRIHLSQLDDQQLRDIGITRRQAEAEIRKSLISLDRIYR